MKFGLDSGESQYYTAYTASIPWGYPLCVIKEYLYMKRHIRLWAMILTFSAIALLGISGAVWAGPPEQGTVPSGNTATPLPPGPLPTIPPGATATPGCATHVEAERPAFTTPPPEPVTLNVCTGLATVPFGAFPVAGRAVVDEVTIADLTELGLPPNGFRFLSNGLTLVILNRVNAPIRFFARPVLVCFPLPPGQLGVIRMWDTSLNPNRWVAFPTFRPLTPPGLICTRTRLPGTYAPIGR
jgi:hypothetical protein